MAGFSQKTLDFLVQNRINDSREWFHANHGEYEKHVLHPLRELAENMREGIGALDNLIVAAPQSVISRINRDIRFSNDKSLYRDYMWMHWSRDKKNGACPTFWVDFGTGGINFGVGLYGAQPEFMACFRRMVLVGNPAFLKAFDYYNNQDFFRMEGALYKKSRVSEAPEPYKPWIDRKDIYFIHSEGHEHSFAPEFHSYLLEKFRDLMPVYTLMTEAFLQLPTADGRI